MLTGKEICDVALAAFKNSRRARSRDGERKRQVTFSFIIYGSEVCQHITDEFIKDAMAKLAIQVPEDVIFNDLELPNSARIAEKSEYLHLVMDYCHFTNCWLGQFDMQFELA